MIQEGRASLVVSSTDTVPEVVSEVLSLEPTEVRRRGEVTQSGRVRGSHAWSLDVEALNSTDDDQTGTRALRELLDRCSPAVGRVSNLPSDCDVQVRWWAGSTSPQGGFVLPVELAERISALGVDLYATVYFDEVSAEAPSEST